MNKFIEQVIDGARCYCSHLADNHKGNCNLCVCEMFKPLPRNFFMRCPDADNCNSTYFYPNDENDDIFHCHYCETSFKFDGFESFSDLNDIGVETPQKTREIEQLQETLDSFGITLEFDGAAFKPSMMDKFRKAQNDTEVAELKAEIERLRAENRKLSRREKALAEAEDEWYGDYGK